MATAGLGTKRECSKCAAKFYDLGATPVVCPKCGTVQKLETKPKAVKKAEPVKPKKTSVKPIPRDDDEAFDALEEGEEELEALDDLDDAPEVISLEEVEEHQEESEVNPNSDDAEDGMFMEEMQGEAALFDAFDPDAELDEDAEDDDSDEEDGDNDSSSRKRRKK